MAKNKTSQKKYPSDLKELSKQKGELEEVELFLIKKALESNSPQAYIEAKTYIKNIQEKKGTDLKSFTLSPMKEYYNGSGYRYKPMGLSTDLIRNMAQTPQIKAIINTRLEQCANFNQPTANIQKSGWTINKKSGIFDTSERKLTKGEMKEIESIVDFLETGGRGQWDFDGWETFTRKVFEDSWALDQGVFEVAVDRMGRPTYFEAYDGATFYLADDSWKEDQNRDAYSINGYLPKYVQAFNNTVYREYYPWELCFGTRNATTNYKLNGYGLSENETLIQVITWMLNSNNYNGNFFSQGSNPKGILNFKNNVDPAQVENFKQAWRNTLSGVNNSHKLAVTSGAELEWINMQLSNKDMEFHEWNRFLTVLACTVFRIDPDEVGFHLDSGSGVFGQDGQKERLKHSKEKGLDPFLKFWQRKITKYLVGPFSGGKYQFEYTGLEPEDEEASLKRDVDILGNGGMSVQDFFLKYSERDLDINKDILLNQIMLQYKQLQVNGDPESNEAVANEAGEEPSTNVFDEFDVQKSDNPYLQGLNKHLENLIEKTNE